MSKYDELIGQAATAHLPDHYDARLFRAQIFKESTFNPKAVSSAGAQGLAQIMPATFEEWSLKLGYVNADPFDPETSLSVGAAYLNNMIVKWYYPRPEADRFALALASYNAGAGNIIKAQRHQGDPPLYADIIPGLVHITGEKNARETRNYVSRIFEYYTQMIVLGKIAQEKQR